MRETAAGRSNVDQCISTRTCCLIVRHSATLNTGARLFREPCPKPDLPRRQVSFPPHWWQKEGGGPYEETASGVIHCVALCVPIERNGSGATVVLTQALAGTTPPDYFARDHQTGVTARFPKPFAAGPSRRRPLSRTSANYSWASTNRTYACRLRIASELMSVSTGSGSTRVSLVEVSTYAR